MTRPITLSREDIADLVAALRVYFRDELDQDLGVLPAEMLLDFIRERIGPAFYNRGLEDAQAVVNRRAADLAEAIAELEHPVGR